MMKSLLVVGAAACFAVLLCSARWSTPVAAGPNDSQRQAQDRQQIEKLMWRYTRSLDSLNADAYASTYTPDGEFDAGPNPVKGHDALKKMIADLRQRNADAEAKGEKRPAMYHMEMNSYLEFVDNDHARLEGYWQTVFGGQGPSVPVRVAAAGREINEIVRVNGQWLIRSRNVAPTD